MFSGTVRKNIGQAGIGAALLSPTSGYKYPIVSQYFGTNYKDPSANYEALIAGLHGAQNSGVRHLLVCSESENLFHEV